MRSPANLPAKVVGANGECVGFLPDLEFLEVSHTGISPRGFPLISSMIDS